MEADGFRVSAVTFSIFDLALHLEAIAFPSGGLQVFPLVLGLTTKLLNILALWWETDIPVWNVKDS